MTQPADTMPAPAVDQRYVAHGGTRHADVVLCTSREYRELLTLRRQIADARTALARADAVMGGHAPVPSWLVDDIRDAVACGE